MGSTWIPLSPWQLCPKLQVCSIILGLALLLRYLAALPRGSPLLPLPGPCLGTLNLYCLASPLSLPGQPCSAGTATRREQILAICCPPSTPEPQDFTRTWIHCPQSLTSLLDSVSQTRHARTHGHNIATQATNSHVWPAPLSRFLPAPVAVGKSASGSRIPLAFLVFLWLVEAGKIL